MKTAIKIEQQDKAWTIGWTQSDGVKNTRWLRPFKTLDDAVKFAKGLLK